MPMDNSKEGTGAVWVNYSSNHPRAPDLVGEITIDGVTHRIAMWESESNHPRAPEYTIKVTKPLDHAAPKTEPKRMAAFTPKQKRMNKTATPQEKPPVVNPPKEDFDDDVPF